MVVYVKLRHMGCCRDNSSDDVKMYTQLTDVATFIERNLPKLIEDLNHPIKGPKLKKLIDAVRLIES